MRTQKGANATGGEVTSAEVNEGRGGVIPAAVSLVSDDANPSGPLQHSANGRAVAPDRDRVPFGPHRTGFHLSASVGLSLVMRYGA